MSLMAQIIAYIISPLATLLAVWVAYLALLRGSQPQIVISYQPNPDIPSLIDLVIENKGGSAFNLVFSVEIPINCFGIEKPHNDGEFLSKTGAPIISAGQRYIYNGGQYAGLKKKIENGLPIIISFKYQNPLGFLRKGSESFTLGIDHLKGMPTRTSANQAIVDALKGPNKTTLQEIRNELRSINDNMHLLIQQRIEPGSK